MELSILARSLNYCSFRLLLCISMCCFVLSFFAQTSLAASPSAEFKIAIMQAQKGAAQKYRSLEKYLQTQGIQIRFVGTSSYTAAAKKFANGKVDGMFSGSGVAGSMLLKELAVPVLRPEDPQGISTYWAVVIAPIDSPKFNERADYFLDKKIILCSLASSGEFYYRSFSGLQNVDHSLVTAPSHGAALAGLARGIADVAIVKNRVWDSLKEKYPKLQQVGRDSGENPNGTLIVSKNADTDLIDKITKALLSLETATSPEAQQVRQDLAVRRYLPTRVEDFKHTIKLLKKAGVNKDFEFTFADR